MNVTLTLVMYWSIAIALAGGGLYALNRGFALLVSSRGRKPEENTIEALGLKVKTGSIGSVVMMTAFLWGWAAAHALPNYKDPNVTITALQASLAEKTRVIDSLETNLDQTNNQLVVAKRELSNKTSDLARFRTELDEKTSQLAKVRENFAGTVAIQKQELAQVQQQLERLQQAFNETTKDSKADLRVENRMLDESLTNLRTTLKRLDP